MLKDKPHKIIITLSLLLVVSLLVPSAVKFAHAFENHKHEVCTNKSSVHIHTLDLDCEFYKFKIANQFVHKFKNVDFINIEDNHGITESQYQFISEYQRLQFSLRGPPFNS
ncbi:hypothetical protein C1T31_09095 [Hanstruepera neustonica]|uniref:Uncharacterized protein n=1 Tax=Hanstruepera neustonica TaxID=1445657 RepID=A0A2K1DYP3_9FLAO|nr:hypothetical protein [Hanstruepera neustonica]PNQ73133.1 hypothetical protein C1T31_09095 [Hanstruepera neustonica]